jgi:hypothetical protein
MPPEPTDAPAGGRGTVPPQGVSVTMLPLTGAVERPGRSIAGFRSVEGRRPLCSPSSWGTVQQRGAAITKTITTGEIMRPGTFVPKDTLIGD